jgi:ubiquinol-cytochrome c reductase cytochrome c1 subunit
MKNILYALLLLLPLAGNASEEVELQDADYDLTDKLSLQRGAKYFVTYCLGCHSAKHIRYLRIAHDFDIDKKTVLQEVAPQGASIYDTMHTAMNAHDAAKWFGTTPPDLSLIARSRGPDWIYTYLKSFYVEHKRTFGVNNLVFKDVGMPNPLWQLQGTQKPVYANVDNKEVIEKLVLEEPGALTPEEYDRAVNDIVNFLVYVGEPMQLQRKSTGKYVLFFILMFTAIAYLLKKEYWKDVH